MSNNYGLFQDSEELAGADLSGKGWFDPNMTKETWFDYDLIGADAAAGGVTGKPWIYYAMQRAQH